VIQSLEVTDQAHSACIQCTFTGSVLSTALSGNAQLHTASVSKRQPVCQKNTAQCPRFLLLKTEVNLTAEAVTQETISQPTGCRALMVPTVKKTRGGLAATSCRAQYRPSVKKYTGRPHSHMVAGCLQHTLLWTCDVHLAPHTIYWLSSCVTDSFRELKDTVKKLSHTKVRTGPEPKGQQGTKPERKQLALEAPPKDAREPKRVKDQEADSRPGYVSVRGKFYKRGLLHKLLVHTFGYPPWQANSLCLDVILSTETDSAKRHAQCTNRHRTGHKTDTDSCHAFSKSAELLKLYKEQYLKDYVVIKQDFR
jgi:hypothetical protein